MKVLSGEGLRKVAAKIPDLSHVYTTTIDDLVFVVATNGFMTAFLCYGPKRKVCKKLENKTEDQLYSEFVSAIHRKKIYRTYLSETDINFCKYTVTQRELVFLESLMEKVCRSRNGKGLLLTEDIYKEILGNKKVYILRKVERRCYECTDTILRWEPVWGVNVIHVIVNEENVNVVLPITDGYVIFHSIPRRLSDEFNKFLPPRLHLVLSIDFFSFVKSIKGKNIRLYDDQENSPIFVQGGEFDVYVEGQYLTHYANVFTFKGEISKEQSPVNFWDRTFVNYFNDLVNMVKMALPMGFQMDYRKPVDSDEIIPLDLKLDPYSYGKEAKKIHLILSMFMTIWKNTIPKGIDIPVTFVFYKHYVEYLTAMYRAKNRSKIPINEGVVEECIRFSPVMLPRNIDKNIIIKHLRMAEATIVVASGPTKIGTITYLGYV